MSKLGTKLLPIILLICLSAVLVCAFLPQQVVFAVDTRESIKIKASFEGDNIDWAAQDSSGNAIWNYRGDFVSDEAVSSLKQALALRLWNDGKITYETFENFYATDDWNCHDYFDVSFEFPYISATALDATQTAYTLQQSPIVIRADFERVVSASPTVCLEYNKIGSSEKKRTPSYEPRDVVFGNGTDVGVYEVVCIVTESFKFEGKDYSVERRAQSPISCTVTKANLQMQIGEVVVEYGTSVADIGRQASEYILTSNVADVANGTFLLSDNQEDSAFDDVVDKNGLLLNVKDGGYTIKFDYEHNSGNFNPLTNISVKVKIKPKQVVVKISDLYSLVGDELLPMSEVKYYIATPLVGNDDEVDLGIAFDCNPDNTAVGVYLITAKFANGNYVPKSESQTSAFIDGGRYMVFAKSIAVSTSDGENFVIYFEKGFVEIKTVVIELIAAQSLTDDKEIVRAYRILLADNDANPVDVEGNYYVSWTSKMANAAWVSIGRDVQNITAIDTVGNGLALDKDNNEIYFYIDVVKEQDVDIWTWQNVLLLCVSCTLLAATIVLATILGKGRRYLK